RSSCPWSLVGEVARALDLVRQDPEEPAERFDDDGQFLVLAPVGDEIAEGPGPPDQLREPLCADGAGHRSTSCTGRLRRNLSSSECSTTLRLPILWSLMRPSATSL